MFDKSKYDQEYAKKNIVRKNIPFNKTVPDDVKILEWLKDRPEGMTAYIKALILDDMAQVEKEKKTSTLTVCLVDGFEDKEAIKAAIDGGHNILTVIKYGFEIKIDTDEKKVLSVRRFSFCDHVPDVIFMKMES